MDEYIQQATDFLEKANATCEITFGGCTTNENWKEKEDRNFYNVKITTPRGSMGFVFWDSLYNTRISKTKFEDYVSDAGKYYSYYASYGQEVKARNELKAKKAAAVPSVYSVLACLTKYDPGTFEDFCSEFGYDEDSKRAEKIYIDVIREFKQLEKIFSSKEMEELAEIC